MRIAVRDLATWVVAAAFLALALTSSSSAQEGIFARTTDSDTQNEAFQAPVVVEGRELFRVRGSSALPADERAETISRRIIASAKAEDTVDVTLELQPGELGPTIFLGDSVLTVVTQADADFERMEIEVLAHLQMQSIEMAIESYRVERTGEARVDSLLEVLLWTAAFAVATVAFVLTRRRLPTWLERRVMRKSKELELVTHSIVRLRVIGAAVWHLTNLVLIALYFIALYYYLSRVLLAITETRPIAQFLLRNLTDPIVTIVQRMIDYIPSFITLLVIFLVARVLLKTATNVFESIESGTFEVENFERHWIVPTHNIVRIGIILVATVFAYPYIPGSGSAAFQGLTILVGIMVSLGSSSVVGNILSGLFVIYRRSTNVGDRIKVGDTVGDVIEIKLMETHMKSIKNELVSIPNSQLLNSEVVNYSRRIDDKGLLVHTTVGIGYEEPSDKIEAMLIEAAKRTDGLKNSPAPFVLCEKLADYAINYQVNAFSDRGEKLPQLRSELHRNIVNVFNENGVQIMTPSYIADTPEPKIPVEQWDGKLARTGEIAKTKA